MSSNTYNEDDNIRSNKYNEDDNIDLLFASYHGDLDEIVYLFFKGIPNVNVKGNNKVTPLILASQQGKLDVVEDLLDRGAGVNDVMTDGKTALLMACKNGHTEIVKILMAKGADQSLKSTGKSPRDVAIINGHTEIVKILDSYSSDRKISPKIRGGKRRKTIRGRKGKRRQTNKRKRT
jgi:ankyrin repeat protein